jgi:hypothetical protein
LIEETREPLLKGIAGKGIHNLEAGQERVGEAHSSEEAE